jgi:hypothetical protein
MADYQARSLDALGATDRAAIDYAAVNIGLGEGHDAPWCIHIPSRYHLVCDGQLASRPYEGLVVFACPVCRGGS